MRGAKNQSFNEIAPHPHNKIAAHSLICKNLNTAESKRVHWNLDNNIEFGPLNVLKLKYRKGDLVSWAFCLIGFPQDIGSPLHNESKFGKNEKNTAKSRTIW